MKFALAGNPNCGKTTLFNALTGSTAHVGNWPGVTVDKKEGVYKKCEKPVGIIDLPGIYSLSPYTPEEVIARNYLLEESPDLIINIVDATNPERNLYLTTQLLETDIPVVIALNMIDEVKKQGGKIDVKGLEKKIGVPVVEISALKEENLDLLMSRAYEFAKKKRNGITVVSDIGLQTLIYELKRSFESEGVTNPLFHAMKIAELDEIESEKYPAQVKTVQEFKSNFNDKTFGNDIEAIIADARYKYITEYYAPCIKPKTESAKKAVTKSDKIDRVLTHKIWGIPIFLAILFLIFHLTFSEDLLFLGKFGVFGGDETEAVEVLNETETEEEPSALESFISEIDAGTFFGLEEGLNSPGVILQSVMETFTGFVTAAVDDALSKAGTSEWLKGLIVEGMLGGISSVLSFLPQILVLFMFFSILEDSGYMARVAFILDRIFRRFGLSGRAFMPMIMGFGCSVPAMINTRTLADENERTATVRVIPFFSCGAKLPILTAIAGGIVLISGVGNADIITYSMYVLGMVTAIVSVILMRSTVMKGDVPPFIMELPAYRLPGAKNLVLHLWDKTKHFVKKAFTIILASTVIIWFISHFTWNWEFLSDENMNESILAGLGGFVQPLFTPMGFGSQLGKWGWVFVAAAITGLIAKENVIATFGTLAACIIGAAVDTEADGGISAVMQMISATGITVPALLAFIAFNMTTIPCFAAVATAKAELGNKNKFRGTLVFWLVASYIVATMVYVIGSWWWTAFIFAALWIVAIVIIVLKNKHDKRTVIKEN